MRRWQAAGLVAALASTALAPAQPTFHATVNAVRVDVSVTTRQGMPVRGLTADNFVVTDNGVPQSITSVTLDDRLPLRIVLALDTSGSVQGPALTALVNASLGLLDALRPDDRLAVLTFSGQVRLVSPFGATRAAVKTALEQVHAGGRTSIYDALQMALELVRADPGGPVARPLVLVCSDGRDTGSWLGRQALLEAVRHADVVAHAIEPHLSEVIANSMMGSILNPPEAGLGFLRSLTDLSGGRTWPASDMTAIFLDALNEMRARYLLTFSTPVTPASGWHALAVTLKNAHGDVRARRGYYVENKQTS